MHKTIRGVAGSEILLAGTAGKRPVEATIASTRGSFKMLEGERRPLAGQ